MSINIHRKRVTLNYNQIIALAYVVIIILGTILLALPFSTKGPGSCGVLTGLFTATSAVCVTGLSLVDIWTTYSMFGQFVILVLMEVGGLGFMSIVSVLFHLTNHHNDVQSLSLMAESIGSDELKHITRIQNRLLIGSVLFEVIGAIALFFSFLKYYDVPTALWFGLFHSISAFCNAGFDLMGKSSPGSSLTLLNGDPEMLMVIGLLVVIGGIGFIVWDDIATHRHPRDWSVYTKLVLNTSIALIVFGAVFFMIFEFNNPDTFGNMTMVDKISNSIFQSITPRTAGFAAIDLSKLSDKSMVLTIFLMIIGGSAGSTAGGIKTVTFLILLKAVISSAIGKSNPTIMHRSITREQITQAYTIICSIGLLGIIGSYVICMSSGTSFIEGLFESASALATVGLSLGITSSVSIISKLLLIVFMYIGRIGLLTLTIGFFKAKDTSKLKYPSVKIMF